MNVYKSTLIIFILNPIIRGALEAKAEDQG